MLHLWIITLFLAVLLRDTVGVPPGAERFSAGQIGAAFLAVMAVLALFCTLMVRHAVKRVRREGSLRAIFFADRALGTTRFLTVTAHVVGVLALGWLDAVRAVVGDPILIDELLGVLPAITVFVVGWWAAYPIERATREAVLLRDLDRGRPVYAPPTRGQYVVSQIRHHVLLVVVPMIFILGWIESLDRVLDRIASIDAAPGEGGLLGAASRALASPAARDAATLGGQLIGIAAVILFVPLVLRLVWDTAPLGRGPVRERLTNLCRRHAVRVRELLVWRTHGSMVNGAVMGFIGPVRYILLTDALLDSLPEEQVEAVMAHEVAHVRCKHMFWLLVALIGSVGCAALAISSGAEWIGLGAAVNSAESWAQLSATAVVLLVGLLAFGFVSRRFEWQADAFAARHMSDSLPAGGEFAGANGTPTRARDAITPEGVDAMSGALDSVAALNHIQRTRFTWRHGSIADRQRRLQRLAGAPADGLPIDRTVRMIKAVSAAALAVLIVGAVFTAV